VALSTVLNELYGQPDAFLSRLSSELALHSQSIYALANAASMDYCNVKKYFAGRRRPSVEIMVRLDEAMGRLVEGG
jgi:hypothetical protein